MIRECGEDKLGYIQQCQNGITDKGRLDLHHVNLTACHDDANQSGVIRASTYKESECQYLSEYLQRCAVGNERKYDVARITLTLTIM